MGLAIPLLFRNLSNGCTEPDDGGPKVARPLPSPTSADSQGCSSLFSAQRLDGVEVGGTPRRGDATDHAHQQAHGGSASLPPNFLPLRSVVSNFFRTF